MRKLKWYQKPCGLIQDFKFENHNLIYRNDLISLDIKLIQYLLITGGVRANGFSLMNIVEKGTNQRIPFITITLELKLWLLNKISSNVDISTYYDKNALMGMFLYEDIFEELLKRGFDGEIYIVSDIYNRLQPKWTEYARAGLLNFEKVHLYDTWNSDKFD